MSNCVIRADPMVRGHQKKIRLTIEYDAAELEGIMESSDIGLDDPFTTADYELIAKVCYEVNKENYHD